MGNRISEVEAERRRQPYRDTHDKCWALVVVKGKLYLCLKKATAKHRVDLHHIAGGRGIDDCECWANYFPAGSSLLDNHHDGWAHANDKQYNLDKNESRLWQFALKVLVGEATVEEVVHLMTLMNRTWWKEEMGAHQSLEHEMERRRSLLAARISNWATAQKVLDFRRPK